MILFKLAYIMTGSVIVVPFVQEPSNTVILNNHSISLIVSIDVVPSLKIAEGLLYYIFHISFYY